MVKAKGFNLIELLITILIAAILVGSAVKIFTDKARQGRRIDAINSLLSISLAQERYRANNATYGTLTQVWGGVTMSGQGYYTLSISGTSATAYTVTATATGDQVNDSVSGTSCTPLVLSVSNGTMTRTPAVCWPS